MDIMAEKESEGKEPMTEPTAIASSSPLAPSAESLSKNPWASTDESSPPLLSTHPSTTSLTSEEEEEEYYVDSDYGFDTDEEDPLDEGECLHRRHSRGNDAEDKNERAEDNSNEEETTVCCGRGLLPCLKQTATSVLKFIRDIIRKIPRQKLIAAIAVIFAMRASRLSTKVDVAVDENEIPGEGINAAAENADEVLTDLTNSVVNAVVDKITE